MVVQPYINRIILSTPFHFFLVFLVVSVFTLFSKTFLRIPPSSERHPTYRTNMSAFPRFKNLPAELRLEIWRHAARETCRIIKLDAHPYVAIAGDYTGKHEAIVYGGRFEAHHPAGQESLIWPPHSQNNIASLLATCVEARDAVLRVYPDTIDVREPDHRQALWHASYRGFALPASVKGQPPKASPRRRYRLRCNFETDIFFIRENAGEAMFAQSDLKFALMLYTHMVHSGSPEKAALDYDNFRNSLGKIRYLMCEARPQKSRRAQQDYDREALEYLLAGTTSLEELYLCPWGTKFGAESYHFAHLSEEIWEGKFPAVVSKQVRRQFEQTGQLFERHVHRFREPICRSTTVQQILAISETLEMNSPLEDGPNIGAKTFREYRDALGQVLPSLGYQGEYKHGETDNDHLFGLFFDDVKDTEHPPSRTLEVQLRSSKVAEENEGDAVWLPRAAGYVSEKWDSLVDFGKAVPSSYIPLMTVDTY